jgi:hypothetical protein
VNSVVENTKKKGHLKSRESRVVHGDISINAKKIKTNKRVKAFIKIDDGPDIERTIEESDQTYIYSTLE